MPKNPKILKVDEDEHYEATIAELVGKLNSWRSSNEPTDEFARRVVGSLRTSCKHWMEPNLKVKK